MLPPLIPHKLPPYTLPQKSTRVPGWLYGIAITLFLIILFFVAALTRTIAGPPFRPHEGDAIYPAWLLYTLAWLIYIIREHKKPGVSLYIQLSILIYVLAVIGAFLFF